jgi:hypothetical protein
MNSLLRIGVHDPPCSLSTRRMAEDTTQAVSHQMRARLRARRGIDVPALPDEFVVLRDAVAAYEAADEEELADAEDALDSAAEAWLSRGRDQGGAA